MKASGNFISNSTASWMWRACQRKEWNLHSCLNRCVLLIMLHFIEHFNHMWQLVLKLTFVSSGP